MLARIARPFLRASARPATAAPSAVTASAAYGTTASANSLFTSPMLRWGALAVGGLAATAYCWEDITTPMTLEAGSVPSEGVPGTNKERTFLMVKPDGVQRNLVGEIIGRWERRGYKLVAIKMIAPDKKLASAHYADLSGRPFFKGLVDYMSSSGPVVAMVWEGQNVIDQSRHMLGITDPQKCELGTVRGDLSINIGRNTMHGSDGSDGAKSEINLWFRPEEINNYVKDCDKWAYE